jgi:FdhD protein
MADALGVARASMCFAQYPMGVVPPRHGANGQASEFAEEMPLNIIYGGLPFAVMMVTPSDLEDFVFGFSLTEGVITDPSEIRGVSIAARAQGAAASVDLVGKALGHHLARRRSISGRTGCGLCGIEDLDQLPVAAPVASAAPPSLRAVKRALGELRGYQPLHENTGAMHAAAWCDEDGRILLAREDVGRHNALDKLIGACLRTGLAREGGFVLITSRCSFEMVEKAAAFGAAAMVAISAPTSLAVERASALGMTLMTKARPEGANVFTPGKIDVSAGIDQFGAPPPHSRQHKASVPGRFSNEVASG